MDSWVCEVAKEFKKRDNPKEWKPQEAIVISLSPIKLKVLDGKVILAENKNLIIPEWFKKRWNIDQTFALSQYIPQLIQNITDLSNDFIDIIDPENENQGVLHSYPPAVEPDERHNVEVRQGFQLLSQVFERICDAIEINKTEILQLKLDLQIDDKVLIIPSSQDDVFILIDKV